MVRHGIHPLMRTMRVVLTNGASFELGTVSNRVKPYKLQKDPLNHPSWNPEISEVDLTAGRVSQFMKKYNITEEEVTGQPGKQR
jgi:ribosomal protein L31|mmetsp:Transcript_35177/g.62715  ORF Transcript_35177/g.62715 Transcript_35177/m.62715 type:complete len:84 (+) Transcript_35177:262-513(+)